MRYVTIPCQVETAPYMTFEERSVTFRAEDIVAWLPTNSPSPKGRTNFMVARLPMERTQWTTPMTCEELQALLEREG